MEQAFKCLDIQESPSRDVNKQALTELEDMIAAIVQEKERTFKLFYEKFKSPASSLLQLNRYSRNPFRKTVE